VAARVGDDGAVAGQRVGKRREIRWGHGGTDEEQGATARRRELIATHRDVALLLA
jgi:hypothetical protein